MAFSVKDVVTDKLNMNFGGAYFNKTIQKGPIDFETVINQTGGWRKLGDFSSDGEEYSREMDSNDKIGHGGTYGRTYSAPVNQFTGSIIGSRTKEVKQAIYGDSNIIEVPAEDGKKGYLKTDHTFTGIVEGTWLLPYIADNGLATYELIRRGQTDPNVTYTRVDSDITAYEITVVALEVDDLEEDCFFRETLDEVPAV